MAALGLCVSPGTMPDRAEVDRLNPPFLRSLLYIPEDLYRLQALGKPLFLTINNEFSMVRNWDGWEDAMRFVASHTTGQVMAVGCGNELDIFWSRNRNDVPPGFAADLVNRAQPILRAAGIDVCTTSVAGPEWVAYLDQMLQWCSPDLVDLHPYGWSSAGLDNKLAELQQVAQGHRMACTEVGVHIGDAGGEYAQADLLAHADAVLRERDVQGAWFAWKDQVGAPWERGEQAFGLVAEDGRRRRAWDVFSGLGQAVTPAGPDLSPWAGKVGAGLLAELAAVGERPVWDQSVWPGYGEVVKSNNGDLLVWVNDLQRILRVPSEAA